MKTYFARAGFRQQAAVMVRENEDVVACHWESPDVPGLILQSSSCEHAADARPLVHHPHHSPTGHGWGYGGSGPAELAKDMLWDLLGAEPKPSLYQAFKTDVIAKLDQNAGFTLPESKIRDWLILLVEG